jgi:DNA polymerase-3 subunit epsilon
LYAEKDAQGYMALKVLKADGRKKEITSFVTLQEGRNFLFKITAEYQLCQKINGLYETNNGCFQLKIKECNGACMGQEAVEDYNARVEECLSKMRFDSDNMVVIDRGRSVDERSAVLIENGVYKGYCFFDLNYQVHNVEILKNIIIPMQHNRDTKTIIQGYLRRHKVIRIVKF